MLFCKNNTNIDGFTLLEFLVVIFFMSLIFAFSLPLTSKWYQDHLVWVIQKNIEQAIEQGTQESLILGEPLRLIPLHDQAWRSGLMLVRESDLANKKQDPLHIWQWPNTVYHIIWHGFLSNTYLRFTPDLSQSAMNGYFLIENSAHHGVKMVVNRIGRVRVLPAEQDL
ncbi:MAG: pilus assembly FimT family protein [Gammaproteobacteria bacterium]